MGTITVGNTSTVNLCKFYFVRLIWKPTDFFVVSGVQFSQTNQDTFHFHHTVFYPSSNLKSKLGNIIPKGTSLSDVFKLVILILIIVSMEHL
jgi:hypothetical protein